jgi:hypothetical protein
MHRPTFQNAIGGSTQGARRVHAPKRGISVRDILGDDTVKERHFEPDQIKTEDKGELKRQLEEKEAEAARKKGKVEQIDSGADLGT